MVIAAIYNYPRCPQEVHVPVGIKRRCRYCKGIFTPIQRTQVFCSAKHQKAFWKHGAMPFEKLLAQVELEARRVAREEFEICLRKLKQELADAREEKQQKSAA